MDSCNYGLNIECTASCKKFATGLALEDDQVVVAESAGYRISTRDTEWPTVFVCPSILKPENSRLLKGLVDIEPSYTAAEVTERLRSSEGLQESFNYMAAREAVTNAVFNAEGES